MSQTAVCACGSEKSLSSCCLPIIEGKRKAATAEDLLRARYTSFTRGTPSDIDFIMQTHHTRTSGEIKRDEVEAWARGSEWLGLKILQKEAGEAGDQMGTIVFHARYNAEGKANDHYEQSHFEKEDGEWKFLDAQGLKQGPIRRDAPKIGRNDVCPCGSGKKYKKCCAA